ncbi:MAG: ABC-F family ATP-binding cassette domain-containing protein [Actinomycetota bacterium]
MPVTLTARDIRRSHGPVVVLDGVSLTVGPRSRIGVVGPNGAGKSTLLRILAGLEPPDGGVVERAPASLTVGYLPQEPDAHPGETLLEYLARRTGVAAASAEVDRLAEGMGDDLALIERYTSALDRFLALGGDDLEARAAAVSADLGLPSDRLAVPVGSLSGGQAARAALAAILLSRFDVLLLDEPTNDLDFAGLARLERFLVESDAAVVIVSHDRALLEHAVDRVLEIEEGGRGAREYGGGWAEYLALRDAARRNEEEAYATYVAERERLKGQVQQKREWASQGAKKVKKSGETDKFIRHFNMQASEKQASKARMSERRLERLDRVDKPWEGWELQLKLEAASRSGEVVFRLEQAIVERGSFRLGPIDLEVSWQDRLAIIGRNGTGKTTLLHALLGRLPLVSGSRFIGPGVVVGDLDQRRAQLTSDAGLLRAFSAASGLVPQEARSLLAKFGLGVEHVERPTSSLSPGERTRAVLAALMARGMNCLVLDEPTNHLDLPAIEQLETALGHFDGTVLLVTHDRRLLERFEATAAIDLG